MSQPDLVEIGYVGRPHGVRGDIKCVPHNPNSQALYEVEAIYVGGRRYAIHNVRHTARALLVTLEGVSDRDSAAALQGQRFFVERSALGLATDDVLLADMVGCAVLRKDGRPYGTVIAVEVGPQDRLVIRDGEVERQLPVVDAFVLEVDLKARTVTVDPPEGLPEAELS